MVSSGLLDVSEPVVKVRRMGSCKRQGDYDSEYDFATLTMTFESDCPRIQFELARRHPEPVDVVLAHLISHLFISHLFISHLSSTSHPQLP